MGLIQQYRTWNNFRETRKLTKEYQKDKQEAKSREIFFQSCPSLIEPIAKGANAGKYVMINGKIWAQAVIIGKQEKNRIQPGFDEDFNIYAIDELIKIARVDNTSIMWAHIKVTIDPMEEAEMLGDAIKNVSMNADKEKQGDIATLNTEHNKLSGIDLKKHTATSFKGRDHYFKFGLVGVVVGRENDKVDSVVTAIEANCRKSGVRFEIPFFNQVGIVKTVLPTNFITSKVLQPVTGRTVAAMSPLRNPNPRFPDQGIIICENAETGKPIKINPTKEKYEATFIMAPAGSGKTVFELIWSGRALANGDRVIIIEPKNEDSDGTDYRNFCNDFGGKLNRIGKGYNAPNLLMVCIDEKSMGSNKWAYDKALHDHFDTLLSVFTAWIGPTFKNRMKGKLVESLIELYIEFGIIDRDGNAINTDEWKNPKKWPSIHELREHWKHKLDIKHDPSIEALIQNTMLAMPGGFYWWFANSKESLDIDNDFIIYDVSQLSDNIKSAFSIFIMGAVNTRYFPKQDNAPRRRTYLFFDELGKLLNTPEMLPHIERGMREARAAYITPVLCTQDPEIDEHSLKVIKANCNNIFLLCNLSDANYESFKTTFALKDEYKSRLLQKGHGIGLYLKDDFGINVNIPLTEKEENALLKSKGTTEKAPTFSGFAVEEAVREIYEKEGFFIEDWMESGIEIDMPGYEYYNITDPVGTGSGSINAYIRKDLIHKSEDPNKIDKIGVEGYRHYSAVCVIAGWMRLHHFPDVQIHHMGKADITWRDGCLEFESQGTHDINDWNSKKRRAEGGFKHIIFTGTGETCKEMKHSEASGFVYSQGSKLLRQLEKIRDIEQYREPRNLSLLQAVSEQMGAL
jgi:hypothetical protein